MAPEKKRDLATTLSIIATIALLIVAYFQYIATTKWNNVENYTRVSVLESKVCTVEANIGEIKLGIEKLNDNQTQLLLMMNNNNRGSTSSPRGGFNREQITGIR